MAEEGTEMVTSSSAPIELTEIHTEARDDRVEEDQEKGQDADAEAEADADGEVDADADADADVANDPSGAGGVTTDQYKALKAICDALTNYKVKLRGEEDHYPSTLFRRIPNKRNLPEYHEIIKRPTAISTLKGKIQTRKYTSIAEAVNDFAYIVHNAQVFNRPNSQPVRDVLVLEKIFKDELEKLVDKGIVSAEDTIFPDLGEIPYATPEPDPVSEEEEEADDDEDDEDDEPDDSDEDGRRKKVRRAGRSSLAGRKRARDEDDDTAKGIDADPRKRRGRPPRVDTPMEARIKAIIKGIRKPKDSAGQLKIRHFEKIPDKQLFPHYFQEIKEPIAVDVIKRKAKRKKYTSLENFLKDLELMFKNAMEYNVEESDIYKDAVDLKAEAHALAEAERQKPDEEYMMEDGRLPLPNGILYKNELWKVGDWVHIQNPNDVTKPIVAQIYRTWQDPEGQHWVNACWYYRPEQTVHQYEKHFYPHEVLKTGQYRDHQIEEVIDRCFVMFFTRYSRGRPREIKHDMEVYVCEARYNEEKHKMNKIKTWASCLPDEVREKDYVMDLFDAPRKIKKIPSPIKHLLKDDAKETDELPQPEWGHANAPPRVGAVHRQPRDENQSPPPEPTPPPPTPPPPRAVLPPATDIHAQIQARTEVQRNMNPTSVQQPSRPTMAPQTHSSFHGSSVTPAPQFGRQPSYPQSTVISYNPGPTQTPGNHQPVPFVAQHQLHPPPLSAAHPTHYAGATPSQAYGRPAVPPAQPPAYNTYAALNPPATRPAEVFVLSQNANDTIPSVVRNQFPQDEQGRVLFFTTPPVDTRHIVEGSKPGDKGKPLAHSAKYLAAKIERDQKIAVRKKAAEADGDEFMSSKKLKVKHDDGSQGYYAERLHGDTTHGDSPWLQVLLQCMTEGSQGADEAADMARRKFRYTTKINRDPWKGVYKDDFDPRY